MQEVRDTNGYLLISRYTETYYLVGAAHSVKHPERFWGYTTKALYDGVLGFKYKMENGETGAREIPYEILDANKGHFILVSKISDGTYEVYKLICDPVAK
jgi:hypothetical protein